MLKLQLIEEPERYVKLTSRPITLGREVSNSFVLHSTKVSDFHAEIHSDDKGLYIVDLLSTKGTFVNEHRVMTRCRLKPWDVIRLGNIRMEIHDSTACRPGCWALQAESDLLSSQFHMLEEHTVIGRDPDCGLTIDWHLLSRRHAEAKVTQAGLQITDLRSRNGTYINGKRINQAIAQPGDELRFDEQRFIVIGPNSAERCDANNAEDLTGFRESITKHAGPTPSQTQAHPPLQHSHSGAIKDSAETIFAGSARPLEDSLNTVESTNTAVLIYSPPAGEQVRHPIAETSIHIGRALDSDVIISDPGVSKQHAEIRAELGGWYIIDNHSRNGISLNGRRVQKAELKDGDTIRIGSSTLLFTIEKPTMDTDDTVWC